MKRFVAFVAFCLLNTLAVAQTRGLPDFSELADTYSIPLRTMARRMVEATGLSPNNYLGRVRLCHAMRILVQTNDSVTDIAFACGFNDSNYFSSRFHQEIGVTPMQFRKQRSAAVMHS